MIARIISRVFEPAILLPTTFVLGALRSSVPLSASLGWLMICLLPVFLYRLWAWRRLRLDWDIKDRQRRVKPLALLLLYLILVYVIAGKFEPRLSPLFLLFLVWGAGFWVITAFITKISGHVAADALATGLIISWFGWQFWPLLLIVPLVAWARVATQNHTVGQVIAGAFYSWFLLVLYEIG